MGKTFLEVGKKKLFMTGSGLCLDGQAKIVISSTTTFLFISNPHTAGHHSKEKDNAVYLSYEEKSFVKKAVKN